MREPASNTADAGIAIINHTISLIDGHRKLSQHEFGISVRESLISVREKLTQGLFFSDAQQAAINNWSKGVQRWLQAPKPKDFQ